MQIVMFIYHITVPGITKKVGVMFFNALIKTMIDMSMINICTHLFVYSFTHST